VCCSCHNCCLNVIESGGWQAAPSSTSENFCRTARHPTPAYSGTRTLLCTAALMAAIVTVYSKHAGTEQVLSTHLEPSKHQSQEQQQPLQVAAALHGAASRPRIRSAHALAGGTGACQKQQAAENHQLLQNIHRQFRSDAYVSSCYSCICNTLVLCCRSARIKHVHPVGAKERCFIC
jgi:hypothetical protein